MSVHAYRIIEVVREKSPSFGWWKDSDVIEFLEGYIQINDQTNEDSLGMVEFNREEFIEFYNETWFPMSSMSVEEFKKEVEFSGGYSFVHDMKSKTDTELREFLDNAFKVFFQLKEDCEKTLEQGDDWVQYMCF